jgi:hypothetical protein
VKNLAEIKQKGIKKAVSFYNTSCQRLNDHIHSYSAYKGQCIDIEGQSYFKGMQLICKKTLRQKDGILHRNYTYSIAAFAFAKSKPVKVAKPVKAKGVQEEGDFVVLKNVQTDEKHNVSHADIIHKFSLPYCNTVHSSQGQKIAEPFVIADWRSATVDWLYTAFSRACRFSDIYFLEENLYVPKEKSMMDEMIKGYKCQDRKAGRKWTHDKEYVDSIWICSMLLKSNVCRCCGDNMVLEKNNPKKVTVNRLDNRKAHIMGNCELLCRICNSCLK